MICRIHGRKRPTFICKHLQYGEGLGFHWPDSPAEPDQPFQNAWCDECEAILRKEGESDDTSERFAGIIAICEGWFDEIKERNVKN